LAILENRIKIRNNLLELSKFAIFSVGRLFTVILLICSFYLLYFSIPKSVSNAILESAGKTLSAGSLIYSETINSVKWANSRLSYFKDLETENLKLKLKISYLQQTKQIASELQIENRALKNLLNVTNDVSRDFVTAKIIGMSNSPYASSAILQSGYDNNVKINDIVRGKLGLIGRISEVSKSYSTVLLINDHNSRIPVITGNSKVKGIIAKHDDSLKIIHLEENHNARVGEIIYTSGDGKIFPKGLPVATIIKITNNMALIEPLEQFNKIEFVIIESNS
jgi:rod shape-determining protein MreC